MTARDSPCPAAHARRRRADRRCRRGSGLRADLQRRRDRGRRRAPPLRPRRARRLPVATRASGARFLDYISDVLVFTSTNGRELRVPAGAGGERARRRALLRGSAGPARREPRRGARRDDVHEPAGARVGRALARRRPPSRLRGRAVRPQPHLRPGGRARRGSRQGRRDLQPARRPRRDDPPRPSGHAARRVRLARRPLGSAGRLLGRSSRPPRGARR